MMKNFRRVSYSTKIEEVFPIWYVLRCEEGKEKKAAKLLKRQCQSLGEAEIFLITFERMKRYEGDWHCQEEPLFCGCVFAEADSQERIENAAGLAAVFRSFGIGGYSLRLMEEERAFLKEISGESHRIIMSKGYIREGTTFVTEGPLCGKEYKIRKIDRHKRLARIDSPLKCYQSRGLWMGLEILEKS